MSTRLLVFFLMVSLLLSACTQAPPPTEALPPTSGISTSPTITSATEEYETYGLAAAYSEDENQLLLVHSSGERALMNIDPASTDSPRITRVDWMDALGNSFVVYVGENGFPEKAVFNDAIFLYTNYENNTVDVAVILPDGSTEISRDVPVTSQLNFQLPGSSFLLEPGAHLVFAGYSTLARNFSLWDAAKFGLTAMSIAGCIGATVATGGLALIPCAGAMVNAANMIIEYGGLEPSPFLTNLGKFTSIAGCVTGTGVAGCYTWIAGELIDRGERADDLGYSFQDEINAVLGRMTEGGGEADQDTGSPGTPVTGACPSGGYQMTSYDGFVDATRCTIYYQDWQTFSVLLASRVDILECARYSGSLECDTRYATYDQAGALDYLSARISEWTPPGEFDCEVIQRDVSWFPLRPHEADHAIKIYPPHTGGLNENWQLILGFDYLNKYIITDVMLVEDR